MNSKCTYAPRQRGYATILMILLVASGIMALTLGALFAVQGAQKAQLAVHGSTQAQARTWSAVEVIRQYLKTLSAADAQNLPASLAVAGVGGGVSATVMANVASASGGRRITVDVSASGGGAATTVRVVYDLSFASAPSDGNTVSQELTIRGDTAFNGDIRFGEGSQAKVYVDGNVTLDNVSVTGLDTLCATGNLTVGATVTINNLCANGNLTLTGSAGATTARVIGNVDMQSAGNIANLTSNGNVRISNGSITNVSTKGNVVVDCDGGCRISQIITEGDVTWARSTASAATIKARNVLSYRGAESGPTDIEAFGSGSADTGVELLTGAVTRNVRSNKNVKVGGWYTYINGTLSAKGNLTLTDGGSTVNGGIYGGSLSGVSAANKAVRQSGYDPQVPVVSVAALAPLKMTVPKVDAYSFKDAANYVFQREGTRIKVTVSNVSNVVSRTYYLGSFIRNYEKINNYLCKTVDASGACGDTFDNQPRICTGGNDEHNVCISVDASGNWTLTGTTLAPGVAFFEGNLTLASGGKYYTTLIATGNITSSGYQQVFAPNWVAYNTECLGNFNSSPATGTGNNVSLNADYGPLALAPGQYCQSGHYVPDVLGNTALLAGSYVKETGNFQGGDIRLGNMTVVYGNVVAGNQMISGGNVTIHGAVLAAGNQGGSANDSNMGGSTTLDLTHLPDTFDPKKIPCSGACEASSGSSGASKVLWARYR